LVFLTALSAETEKACGSVLRTFGQIAGAARGAEADLAQMIAVYEVPRLVGPRSAYGRRSCITALGWYFTIGGLQIL